MKRQKKFRSIDEPWEVSQDHVPEAIVKERYFYNARLIKNADGTNKMVVLEVLPKHMRNKNME